MVAVLGLIIAGLFFEYTRPISIIVIVIVIGVVLYSFVAASGGPNHFQAATDKAAALVQEHLETLARKRLAMVRTDEYGVLHEAAWQKEWRYFIEKVIYPKLDDNERSAFDAMQRQPLNSFKDAVIAPVVKRSEEIAGDSAMPDFMTPTGFEQWCERRLRKLGWTAVTTRATGDQGADVLADKNGFRAVVQCKYYTSPVGNKSVQEVYAARQHYRCDAAAVVTNAGYTSSARTLAGSTGVALLTVHDLDRFDELMGTPWTRVA
ncbi:restriction endonuclease [Hansschlegelia sp. KR7-227]|uniref:restriction endonuclease n=1 Tax=Hansschlegelia sp. KR7-227 TaxID=3400914 RepID=UPI003C0CF336